MDFSFDNTYAQLPERFYSKLSPTPVPSPQLIKVNTDLAQYLGLDPKHLCSREGVEILAGNLIPKGAEPLAMAYAGHQFGNWVPKLGDGRAILLGEVKNLDGCRQDIQLKGAGPTPFSRMGDGRAVLGPVLREYIVSEAMAALKIPTTRTLAALTTGERIQREISVPGAILVRVAQSHIRVGTFQYFLARRDLDALRILADHVIERHYPEAKDCRNSYSELLKLVIKRQAELISKWQAVGFIHGVMNTDNTSVAGETIDYGPCAFMDNFNSQTVFSSIDQMGRYSYCNQPTIAQWNLTCFAETLLPLISVKEEEALREAADLINQFSSIYDELYLKALRRKLGLKKELNEDIGLIKDLFDCMQDNKADFTLTFRNLCEINIDNLVADGRMRRLFVKPKDFDLWVEKWRKRLSFEIADDQERKLDMKLVNPKFIPRNHRIEEVINAAVKDSDFSLFDQFLEVLMKPFNEHEKAIHFSLPPNPGEVVCETYCGT